MSEWLEHLENELRRDVDDSHVDYDACWSALCRRMDEADRLGPLAELKIHRDADEAFWDRVEQGLSRSIAQYDQYDEPIEECIRADEPGEAQTVARAATQLEPELDKADGLSRWELALKAEEFPTQGGWERIEEGLGRRIGTIELVASPRGLLIAFPLARALKVAAVLALAVVGAGGGYWAWQGHFESLPTYLTQAHGPDITKVRSSDPYQKAFGAQEGGTVELANRHGYVHLQRGASLALERMTGRDARYRLDLTQGGGNELAGRATFFVERAERNRAFMVRTTDYDIRVTGTYFRVSLDEGRHVVTEVLEGTVHVNVAPLGDMEIHAGQSLVYNYEFDRYDVRSGGPVVERSVIDAMPDLERIHSFVPFSVSASVAFADVSIDGRYCGATPLCVLLAPGLHVVRIQRGDRSAIDTTVLVERAMDFHAVLSDESSPKVASEVSTPVSPAPARVRSAGSARSAVPATVSVVPSRPGAAELVAAQSAERTNPDSAMAIYRALLSREDTPALIRQSALFAIGRLQAEHALDKVAAHESFMRYLALYPDGTFARESLLRLAELEFEKNPEQAIAYYLRYFDRYPTHYRVPELQYRVGLIYLQTSRFNEAEYMFRQALASMVQDDPGMRRRAYAALHRALVGKGDRANAALVESQITR